MIDYNDMIGRRFEDGGRGPDAYDCYGVLVEAMRLNGIVIPDENISVYAARQAQEKIDSSLEFSWEKLDRPEIPCAVLMHHYSGFAQHIGVMIARTKIMHANIKNGVIIENIANMRTKIVGYYRFTGKKNAS